MTEYTAEQIARAYQEHRATGDVIIATRGRPWECERTPQEETIYQAALDEDLRTYAVWCKVCDWLLSLDVGVEDCGERKGEDELGE